MKKILLWIIPFFLTGCTSYVELKDLDVVANLGIDYIDNQFYITVNTIQKEENEYTYQTFQTNAKTIEEAVASIKNQDSKKLYIAHLNLLIITPTAINQKLDTILSFFLENSESRNDFSMCIADNLNFLEEQEEKNFQDMIAMTEKELGTTKEIQFEEFLKDILETKNSYLPYLNTKDTVNVESIILIQNKKVSTHLTEEECFLVNLLENNIQKAMFEDTTILSNQTTIQFKKQKLNIDITSVLASENQSYTKNMQEKIIQVFEKYKKQNIDIFNVIKKIQITSPKFYQEHQKDLLNHIEFNFHISVKTDTRKKEMHLP